jgi:hypothetical protein
VTQLVSELYDALRAAGINDDLAKAAARAVLAAEDKDQLATKADVNDLRLAMKADLADLKAELTWRIVIAMSLQTAVFSAIVGALKFVKP